MFTALNEMVKSKNYSKKGPIEERVRKEGGQPLADVLCGRGLSILLRHFYTSHLTFTEEHSQSRFIYTLGSVC